MYFENSTHEILGEL